MSNLLFIPLSFSFGIIIYQRLKLRKKIEIDKNTEKYNAELEKQNVILTELLVTLQNKIEKNNEDYQLATKKINELKEEYLINERLLNDSKQKLDDIKATLHIGLDNYLNTIEMQYNNKEKEYDNLVATLQNDYDAYRSELTNKLNQEKIELDKIKSTRAAAIQAQIREREIKENSSFYCIPILEEDKSDIQKLNNIKKTLHKPRTLSMLIWQTYFQKPLKTLSAKIVGTNTKTGIYKITNVETGECYIGQAVDIAKRWNDHAKYGLGIDTPAGSKLYPAMMEYGLYSFSWEVLEECSKELLNEKERFYINLYDSVNYGYNILKGNK